MDLCIFFNLQKAMGQIFSQRSSFLVVLWTGSALRSHFSVLVWKGWKPCICWLFCACTKYWWEHSTHSPYLGSDPKYFSEATKQFYGVKFYPSFKWLSVLISLRYWNIISQISSLTHSGLDSIQTINFLFLKCCSSSIFHHQLGVL